MAVSYTHLDVYKRQLNTSGALIMQAEKIGSQTVLAQIVQMVAQAQRSRAPMQRMADVVAGYFVIAVVTSALLTLCLLYTSRCV